MVALKLHKGSEEGEAQVHGPDGNTNIVIHVIYFPLLIHRQLKMPVAKV
jgi:hypothetical protein